MYVQANAAAMCYVMASAIETISLHYNITAGGKVPRRVLDELLRRIVRDIDANYGPDDRYRTVRDIASSFSVSLQTAQRAVRRLTERGVLRSAARSGLTVSARSPEETLAGKHIAMVSNQHDRRFDQAFLAGARETAGVQGVEVDFVENQCEETSSLAFGEYLLGLPADGAIALAFRDAHLGFYHAMCGGMDVVSDIILDDLPTLPAVQTDNAAHSRRAGRRLRRAGIRTVLIAGYYPPDNRRVVSFREGFGTDRGEVAYVQLTDRDAVRRIDHYLYFATEHHAVFSTDYAANYVLAAKLVQHGVTPRPDTFVIYDSEEAEFHYPGLPSLPCAAPSLHMLGRELAECLLAKWQTDHWPDPRARRV